MGRVKRARRISPAMDRIVRYERSSLSPNKRERGGNEARRELEAKDPNNHFMPTGRFPTGSAADAE